jgi:hypothetical protein
MLSIKVSCAQGELIDFNADDFMPRCNRVCRINAIESVPLFLEDVPCLGVGGTKYLPPAADYKKDPLCNAQLHHPTIL